jgi:hypothetical protein
MSSCNHITRGPLHSVRRSFFLRFDKAWECRTIVVLVPVSVIPTQTQILRFQSSMSLSVELELEEEK